LDNNTRSAGSPGWQGDCSDAVNRRKRLSMAGVPLRRTLRPQRSKPQENGPFEEAS
jgi:hypothetical protein